jgi:geranylgeranyl diphosphate synthase type I
MRFEEMKRRIRTIPEIAAWPQMSALMERVVNRDTVSVWDYPLVASRAVGGSAEASLPGSAAIFCSLIAIHLVDDMLDLDPRGDYHRLGAGPTANVSLAFQAAAHRILDEAEVEPEIRAELQATCARMSLATCFGQGLDSRELRSEEEYWRTVEAKTPPLFGAAFRIGALLGGAPRELADGLDRLGRVLGCFVQVSDDLADGLKSPAGADWNRRSNNLPILYAMTADHPDRERFLDVSLRVDEPDALAEAQQILVKSGAVSYCAFRMIEFSQAAHDVLASLPLASTEPIERLLSLHLRPLHRLLESVGVEEPEALLVV